MTKSITLYTLTLGENVEIEKHIITEDDLRGRLSYPVENESDLDEPAREFLYEEVVLECEQQFIRCIILTEEQLKSIKSWEVDWS